MVMMSTILDSGFPQASAADQDDEPTTYPARQFAHGYAVRVTPQFRRKSPDLEAFLETKKRIQKHVRPPVVPSLRRLLTIVHENGSPMSRYELLARGVKPNTIAKVLHHKFLVLADPERDAMDEVVREHDADGSLLPLISKYRVSVLGTPYIIKRREP